MRLMLEGNLGEIVAKYHVYKFPKWRKTLFLLLLLACKPSYGWHMLGCPTGPTKAFGDYPEILRCLLLIYCPNGFKI